MVDPGEQEEQRVAPELEEAAPGVVHDREESDEAIADRGGQLLGTDLSVLGESFGQLGESRDVDEGDGPLDDPMAQIRALLHPVDDEPWQVGPEEVLLIVRDLGLDGHVLRSLGLPLDPW